MAQELRLGDILPATATDVVVDGRYVKGGYFVIDTLDELNAVVTADTKNIVPGSLAYVTNETKFYQYTFDPAKEGTEGYLGEWQVAELGGIENADGRAKIVYDDTISAIKFVFL